MNTIWLKKWGMAVLFRTVAGIGYASEDDEAVRWERFVALGEVSPTIIHEIRYYGNHNFIGRRITGYRAPKCLLTKEAAQALAKVQEDLRAFSLTLKVYDCYRPQRAANDFVAWAKDLADAKMKNEFYPNVEKKNLFKEGYIAERSGHSRGSTMDLTIVPFPVPTQDLYRKGMRLISCLAPYGKRFNDNDLDMGTSYDCFDPASHTATSKVSARPRGNRLLLKTLMEKHGFQNFEKEWWHYTLKNEPFPDRYFDFEVK